MKVNKDAFIARLSLLGFGTGTLATAAGVPPDHVQKIIATLEIEDGDPVLEVLGDSILEKPAFTELSINNTIAKIEAGELDPNEVYEAESSRDRPRKGLLRYIKEHYGIGD